MTQYAVKARKQYEKDHDMEKFIRTVWQHIQNNARGSHIAEKATRSFLALVRKQGMGSWVIGKNIGKIVGPYKHNKSYGLWPWLEKKGAGVIEERGTFPNTEYKVKDKFYETLCQVVGA